MFEKPIIKVFAPNGAEVWVPVDGDILEAAARLERMGLSPLPPDEFRREHRNEVGALVVRYHQNPDGQEVPVIDVYFRHEGGYVDKYRSMVIYLDREQDRKTLEEILNISLSKLPFYDSDTPLVRGERPDRDEKYVIQVQGLWVVWKKNPAAVEDDRAKKRLFLRFECEEKVKVRLPGHKKKVNGKYPPGHQIILSAVREEAQRLGLEDPEQIVLTFITASHKKPGVLITPSQARAWVRREFGS